MRRIHWLLTACALLAASVSTRAAEPAPETSAPPASESDELAQPAAAPAPGEDAVILHQPRVRALYRRPAEQGAAAADTGSLLRARSGRSTDTETGAGRAHAGDRGAAGLGPAIPLPRAGGIYIEPHLHEAHSAPATIARAPRASYEVVPPAPQPAETGHYGWVPETEPVEGEFIEVYHPAVYRRLGDGSLQLVEEAGTVREQKVRIILTRQWIPAPSPAARTAPPEAFAEQ